MNADLLSEVLKDKKEYKFHGLPVAIGQYHIGDIYFIRFTKKPNWLHRFFTRILLGWRWEDLR